MSSLDPRALDDALGALTTNSDATKASAAEALAGAVTSCVGLLGVDGGGVMLAAATGELRYTAAADRASELLEEGQTSTGEGPCVDAYTSDGLVETDDVLADERWPQLRAALNTAGVRGVVSVPLHLGGGAVGSFNLYSRAPRRWAESDRDVMTRYGLLVDSLMNAAVFSNQADDLADRLQHALDNRVVIERAIGYLMATTGLDAPTAFGRLRAGARSRRLKVVEVAATVLAGRAAEAPDVVHEGRRRHE